MAHCSIQDVKRDALAEAAVVFKENAKSVVFEGTTAVISYGNQYQVKTYNSAFEMAKRKLGLIEDWAAKKFGEKFRYNWGQVDATQPDKIRVRLTFPSNLYQAYQVKKGEFARDIEYFRGDEQLMVQEMYQLEGKESPNKEIESKIKNWFSKVGIQYSPVEKIYRVDGTEIDAVAKANVLTGILEVVEGKRGIDTLPEEAGHFIVELLGDEHPLVKGMMKNIVNYRVYKDVVNSPYGEEYKGDETKLRKEAVGKLIAQVMVGIETGSELPSRIERANSWFGYVWNVIKQKLRRLIGSGIQEDLQPFITTAKMVLEGETGGLKKIEDLSKDEYHQEPVYYELDRTVKSNILDRIKTLTPNYNEVTKKYYVNGKEVLNRVTDLVKRVEGLRFRNKAQTEMSDKAKTLARGGTVGHAWLQMIMDGIINSTATDYDTIKGKVKDRLKSNPEFEGILDKSIEIGNKNYLELVNGARKLYEQIKQDQETINKETGSKEEPTILLEQSVYDELNNKAGTIDVLVIYSNGMSSVYDFKGQNFRTKDRKVIGEVPVSKIQSGDLQLLHYTQMLREVYGIEGFVKTRLLPFNLQMNMKTGTVYALEFGTVSGKGDYREYLEEIPVAKEKTNVAEIDRQLDKMFILRDNLEKRLSKDYKNQKLIEQLNKLNKSIRKLQLSLDTRYVYKEVNAILRDFRERSTRPDGIDLDYLNDTRDYLNVYKDFFIDAEDIELEGVTDTEERNKISMSYGMINMHIGKALRDIDIKSKDILTKESKMDLNKPTQEVGVLGSLFKRFSQFSRPQFKYFYNLIQGRSKYVREQVDDITNKLQEVEKNLNTWAKGQGKDMSWAIDQLLNSKTGNLKSKYNSTFKEEWNKAVADKNYKWFSDNTNVLLKEGKFTYRSEEDAKKFEELKRKVKETYEQLYPGEENDAIRKKKLDTWESTHDITTNVDAILNKPYYVKPNDSERFQSDLWKMMNQSGNKPLLDAYQAIIDINTELAKVTGKDIKSGFIAEVQKGIFESTADWGLGLDPMKNNLRNAFTTREYDVLQGSRDAVTGEFIPSIPLLFTDELKLPLNNKELEEIAEEIAKKGYPEGSLEKAKATEALIKAKEREKGILTKSKDIFKSTILFAESAYTYAGTKDIESTVKALRRSLEVAETEITDNRGKKVVDKWTGMVAKVTGMPKNELEMFDKYMNLYLYGRKIQNKDYATESGISSNKTIQQVMRGTSLKALGLSWIAGMGNLVGTTQNMMFLAAEEKFFTKGQVKNGIKMLLAKDVNAKVLLNYFSPYAHNITYTKANSVSTSWATKTINEDLFYILMKKPDEFVDMIVGLGILQNYGMDSQGRIRPIGKEGIKPLMETLTIDKGKVDGVNEEQYIQIRKLMQNAASKIKGSVPQDDMNLAGTNMYIAMFMQFRNWMPGLIENRFSRLKYDEESEDLDVGRFRVLFGEFTAKGLLPKLDAFGKTLLEIVPFAKYNRYNNPRDLTIAKKYFEKFLQENPELRGKITIDDFIELRKKKLQGMAKELRTLLSLYLLVMLAGAIQPDDEKDAFNKFMAQNAYRMTNRGLLEISFFFDPSSVTQIIKQPLPIFRNVTDLQKLIYNTIDEGRDMAVGTDYKGAFIWKKDNNDKTPPLYYTSKMFPGNRAFTDIFDFFDNFDQYIKK